jgi:hypothetical protein
VDEFAPHYDILRILRLFDPPLNGISETGWPSARDARLDSAEAAGVTATGAFVL